MTRLPFRPGLALTVTCVVLYIAAAAQVRTGATTALDTAVETLSRPVLGTLHAIGTRWQRLVTTAQAVAVTAEEMQDLRRQVSELRLDTQMQAADLLALRQAHRLLEAQPALANRSLVARMRSRDVLTTHTATLDRGARDGVVRDAAVLSEHGVLGRVDRVWESSCRMQLLSHPAAAAAARVEGLPLEGLLTGGDRPVLTGFPPFTEVPEGAPVFTTGSEGIYPPGLLLGLTGTARTTGMFTQVPVHLSARASEAIMVLVLKTDGGAQ